MQFGHFTWFLVDHLRKMIPDFGELMLRELTGDALSKEIPGLKEIHAVDAAGVHPLLLAIGSERYTLTLKLKQPSELLTIAIIFWEPVN